MKEFVIQKIGSNVTSQKATWQQTCVCGKMKPCFMEINKQVEARLRIGQYITI